MAAVGLRALGMLGLGPHSSASPSQGMTHLIGFSVVLILLGIFLVSVMNHKLPGAMILLLGIALGWSSFHTLQRP